MKSDPWVTYRFRKYTASPKRIPWKNQREIKWQHYHTFAIHWALGATLFWPVATVIGRKYKIRKGGVPVVRLNRFVHDFPNVEPGRTSRIFFRWYSVGSSVAFGYLFAKFTTDQNESCVSNEWYNRPDLKPFPAMVQQEENDHMRRTMEQAQYMKQYNAKTSWKETPLYRFFMARDADFTIKDNPYQKLHPEDVWDRRVGHYSTYSNSFGKHHQ